MSTLTLHPRIPLPGKLNRLTRKNKTILLTTSVAGTPVCGSALLTALARADAERAERTNP